MHQALFAVAALCVSLIGLSGSQAGGGPDPSPALIRHLARIAALAQAAPMELIPAGEFALGTKRIDDDPYGLWTQFDDTELPQQRVWLDEYAIDRHEVNLGEYLSYLQLHKQHPPQELQKLLWHVITVHAVSDATLSRWPALYVTWHEAARFCTTKRKRLPTEAEWEKAARGPDGRLFPWGDTAPDNEHAMFGQHHVHEIPILAAVDSYVQGRSPYGLHHMAGNVAEWVQDWFGFDYYAYMPAQNPSGPASGRYKGVRGGSWKSKLIMLRTATRNGFNPDQRSATIGFRCAQSSAKPESNRRE
jgi:formylglycine-generating enzyme required for sulfatase activity